MLRYFRLRQSRDDVWRKVFQQKQPNPTLPSISRFLITGDVATLRFSFAFSGLDEPYREIGKRGLDIRLAKSVPVTSFESREMVTIRQFRDLPEALPAKGILD